MTSIVCSVYSFVLDIIAAHAGLAYSSVYLMHCLKYLHECSSYLAKYIICDSFIGVAVFFVFV